MLRLRNSYIVYENKAKIVRCKALDLSTWILSSFFAPLRFPELHNHSHKYLHVRSATKFKHTLRACSFRNASSKMVSLLQLFHKDSGLPKVNGQRALNSEKHILINSLVPKKSHFSNSLSTLARLKSFIICLLDVLEELLPEPENCTNLDRVAPQILKAVASVK